MRSFYETAPTPWGVGIEQVLRTGKGFRPLNPIKGGHRIEKIG